MPLDCAKEFDHLPHLTICELTELGVSAGFRHATPFDAGISLKLRYDDELLDQSAVAVSHGFRSVKRELDCS